MAQFIKHIGKHNNKKIAIIYRTIPDEGHMSLVAYTETLPKMFHDAITGVIESSAGQDASELADVLFRNKLADGRSILQAMHKEGMIKKVPTSQVIVTPNLQSHIRLDELNKIFEGMEAGGEAAKKMKELDDNMGMVEPYTRATKTAIDDTANVPMMASATDGLDNGSLAEDLDAQADRLALEAKSMIAESKRLKAEAKSLKPKKKKAAKKKVAKKKAVAKKKVTKVTS